MEVKSRARFSDLLKQPDLTLQEVSEWLDGATHEERVAAMAGTCKADQRRLFALADGSAATMQDLVPPGVPDRCEVIFEGTNTLPVFRSFQKRFARVGGQISGYNEGFTRPFVGPGYFLVKNTHDEPRWLDRGEVVVDYFEVPEARPVEGWPEVKHNHQGLQRFVFHHTRDFLRKLSDHVLIGEAYKEETPMMNWFTLVRVEA